MKLLYPELTSWKHLFFRMFYQFMESQTLWKYLNDCMMYGDSNPAVVISVSPLLISAFSEDMDCAVRDQ